ncbi:LCP family protein [Nonomuraea sp. NPDC052634]|uniref:LCP family protein n=1 Tax=Nonomuraea sp. NPDC052634 TaxID=3155813 RepID=UPI0034372854
MSNRDGEDTVPEGRKRRPQRRSRTGGSTEPGAAGQDIPVAGPSASRSSGSEPASSRSDRSRGQGPESSASRSRTPGPEAPRARSDRSRAAGPEGAAPRQPGSGKDSARDGGGRAASGAARPGGSSSGKSSARSGARNRSESPSRTRPGSSSRPDGSKKARPARKPGSGSAAPRFAKPLSPAAFLGWTALSAIVPGAAHLRAGHRRTGLVLISAYAVLLLGLLAYGLSVASDLSNAAFLADDTAMTTVIVLAVVFALAWFALLVTSYIALGPSRLPQQGQVVTGIVVGVLCVAVMSPFALTANYVIAARDSIGAIFPSHPDDPQATVAAKDPENPWGDKERVNFLLIGGDAAGNRTGVRTDSMNVASVDLKTGATVLFSLPRNLQHVRFPPSSPLRKQFPNGFMAELPNGGLLNEVWQWANDHPQVMGGRNQGPRALMDAIGYTLGLKIDYYMLMNMYGFADLVDAIGGLKIRVEKDIKWGGLYGTAGVIKAGYRKLNGEEALWYGRSRVGSDDFSRMARQRCVIGAFAQQATPAVILARFEKIARAAKRLAQTNIPRHLVQPLVELALKVKQAKITSLQFVPPEFYSGRPDWAKIRRATKKAIADSVRPARRAQTANVSASPSVTGASPTRTRAMAPTQTPTKNAAKAQSLDELCGL